MRLYLIRHGQTQWNIEGRAQGHTDIPLDPNGEQQAQRLAGVFQHVPLGRILSSDLQRSAQTAQALAESTGADIELLPGLRERRLGEWEGVQYQTMWAGMAALQGMGTPRELIPAPNGETIKDVWDRLAAISDRLGEIDAPTAVITHGGTGSLLLARLLRGTIHTARAFRLGNCAITELDRRPHDAYVILRYNDTAHLNGLHVMEGNLESAAS